MKDAIFWFFFPPIDVACQIWDFLIILKMVIVQK